MEFIRFKSKVNYEGIGEKEIRHIIPLGKITEVTENHKGHAIINGIETIHSFDAIWEDLEEA